MYHKLLLQNSCNTIYPINMVCSRYIFVNILPGVLYRCENWSVTMREERRLSVFENVVMRNMFGSKRGEVTKKWRRLRNEKLYSLHYSQMSFL
jgi:hypothetical protein